MQESRRYLVHMSSHSPFCPKFRCHGNRGQLGEMRLAAFNGPSRKLPIDAKYLANISDTDRVIANFVPNFVAMATGGRSWENAIGSIQWPSAKTPLQAQIQAQKFPKNLLRKPSYSPFCPKFRSHSNQGGSGVKLNDTIRLVFPKTVPKNQKITTLSYTQPKL